MTDELLWRDVQNNDRDAFGRIVERYQSLVCSVAYAGLGDVAASQDVALEAFVAAWRQRDDLREPSKLRAWLCGIARTITANMRRRDVRRGGTPDSLETRRSLRSWSRRWRVRAQGLALPPGSLPRLLCLCLQRPRLRSSASLLPPPQKAPAARASVPARWWGQSLVWRHHGSCRH